MKRTLLTKPAIAILSPSEIRSRLIIEHDYDDKLLAVFVESATDWAQEYMMRPIMSQQWSYFFDCFEFPLCIELDGVTEVEVVYFDADNAEQTLNASQYYLDQWSSPAKIVPVSAWPSTFSRPNAVRVDVTAGYATKSNVPAAIKGGVALMVGHLYNNREGTTDRRIDMLPMGVESFLDKHKVAL